MSENMQSANGFDHSYKEQLPLEPAMELGNLPSPVKTNAIDYSHMITVIAAWVAILNARLLAIIALIGALALFGIAIYDPLPQRIWGATLYAVGVLWPVIVLFIRKG